MVLGYLFGIAQSTRVESISNLPSFLSDCVSSHSSLDVYSLMNSCYGIAHSTLDLFCLNAYSGLDDLFDVQRELNTVSAKWRNIGIALRLKPNILDGFSTQYSGDASTCLSSTVAEWLKKNYNVTRFGEPTWQWLAEVVGDPAGGANTALAMDIARKHKAVSSRYIYRFARNSFSVIKC